MFLLAVAGMVVAGCAERAQASRDSSIDGTRGDAEAQDASVVDAGWDADRADAFRAPDASVVRDASLEDFGPNPQTDGGRRDGGVDLGPADLGADLGAADLGADLGAADLGADMGTADAGCRPPALGGHWVPVGTLGGALPGDTPAQLPKIAIDDLGRPVVAWRERTSPASLELHVARWDGATWVALGGTLTRVAGGIPDWPTVAIDHEAPVVAWQENGPGLGAPTEIYAARWDEGASAWTPLGGGLSTVPGATTSEQPSIAVLGDGTIIVGWHEEDGLGGMDVHVSRWTGSSWLPLGGGLSALPGSRTWARVASVSGASTPYVAWWEGIVASSAQVFVRRWDGVAWQPVGGPVEAFSMPSLAAFPALAVRPIAGVEQVVLAWRDVPLPTTRGDTFAARWVDPTWVPLGATPASASVPDVGSSTKPHLSLDQDGSPVLLWSAYGTDQRLRVVRFEGGAWQPMGDPIDAGFDGRPNESGLALDGCGTPFVAFDDGVGMQEVFVYRYVAP